MDVMKIKTELRRMGPRELFKLLTDQRIPKCLVGDAPCCFYLRHKEVGFCVSEIMGQGCQLEKLRKSEEVLPYAGKVSLFLPLVQKMEMEPGLPLKKTVEFKVFYKNRPILFLGKVIEKRKKERGDNLKDLLNKAIKDFSDRVKDPSRIFLLGP
jgi:hypothetical protein